MRRSLTVAANWYEQRIHPSCRITKLGASILLGCIISMIRGKDLSWDLLNYHYYAPWALLNDRLSVDLYPAQLQTFFNPVIDLPFYYCATTFPDYVSVLLMGIPFGLAVFVTWNIIGTIGVAHRAPGWAPRINRGLACFLALVGAAGYSQANTTSGEWTTTALALLAIWAIFASHRGNLTTRMALVIAGLSLGMATGLKLTAAIPTLAITLALLCSLSWRSPRATANDLALYAVSGCVSFAAVAGPWMWVLYRDYQNPLFPFFNSLFRSPLLDEATMLDTRFLPGTWVEYLWFPIKTAFEKNRLHTEENMRDPRLLIGGVIALLWLSKSAALWLRNRAVDSQSQFKLFLSITFVGMYLFWMTMFGIYRYAILLEILSILMAGMVIGEAIDSGHRRKALWIAVLVYGSAAILTRSPNWGRTPMDGNLYFSTELPKLPQKSLVLNLVNGPVGYLAPQWPDNPPFVYPISNLSGPGRNEAIQRIINERVMSHRGEISALWDGIDFTDSMRQLLANYHLHVDMASCRPVYRPSLATLLVCPTRRTGNNRTPAAE
ncbi:hypothetical protein AB4156_06150 [Cupriavidus sp. 2MCAB6]|uniref:hypothetical protein n=1 Tax=Cupriavidus sp. 2MCAB6 TaxID=3232981 RepID=UPI003F8F061B